MKRIVVPFSAAGIDRLLKEVRSYKKWLKAKTEEFIEALADEGLSVASVCFQSAQYDGTNDVTCSVEKRSNDCIAVLAVGGATLFIEFGTGIVYPDIHPAAASNGMLRGTYGQGKGSRRAWGYYGDPGTNGVEHTKKDGSVVVITHGNPANMCMYTAQRALEEKFEEIARRIYVW